MEKGNEPAPGSSPRALVNESITGCCCPGEGLSDVVDTERDVVDPFASHGKKSVDGAAGTHGLEQLKVGIPGIDKRDSNSVLAEFSPALEGEAEQISKRFYCLINAPDRNSDVIDNHRPSRISSAAV